MQHELHKKYGDTVRFSPFHVSFCNESAFKDILTKKPSRGQLMKDPYAYNSLVRNGVHSILTAPSDTEHSRYRRLLSHGFSEKALKEQEPLLLRYVDLLIYKLQERAKDGTPQDMVAWYNWTTFDLTGSLTFNDSFDCLESASYHPWIQFVFGNIKAAATITALKFMPVANWIITTLFGKMIKKKQSQNAKFTAEKVAHRLKSQTDCTDFFEHIINRKEGSEEMSRAEIEATSSVLVLGGSETSATLLAGATYLLLQHPKVLRRVKAEVRDRFKSEEEINSASIKELPYLLAVLDESLRIFPPVPIGSPRTVPPQGDTINGYYLPAKVSNISPK
ncbi:hypothetical protein NQ176_g2184 [Zarea fungicola]|uniref:Uncharacterized protein n=1 Tax=Zarea fungicola TaxID=93591 RepID=A0ACC1NRR7_9HYPO|nr:hypothetical protein NQ176_g2184 [Lecanicillium fungicola]